MKYLILLSFFSMFLCISDEAYAAASRSKFPGISQQAWENTNDSDLGDLLGEYCSHSAPDAALTNCDQENVCRSLTGSISCRVTDQSVFDEINRANANNRRPRTAAGALPGGATADPSGTVQTGAAGSQTGNANRNRTMSEFGDMNRCNVAKRDASDCCDDPIKCMTNGFLSKNNKMAVEAIANMILPQLSGADNVQKICKMQQGTALVSGAINVLAINNCERGRVQCANECETIRDSAEQAMQRTAEGTVARDDLAEKVRLAEQALYDCRGFAENTAALSMETMSNLNQYITARTCANSSLSASALGVSNVDLNPDCANAANASNPICTSSCANPANANTAACRQVGNEQLGDGALGSADLSAGRSSTANVPDDVLSQETPFGKYETKNSNAGIAQGGGPSLGGDGGSSGGGMMGGKGGGGSQGKNTDIMQGFRGGGGFGGYSVSGVDTESRGGYSGGGGGGAPPDEGFNLKKFLPGFGAKRSIAGLGAPRANPDLGMAHEDIFSKITRAMARQCIQSALQDCQVSTRPGK